MVRDEAISNIFDPFPPFPNGVSGTEDLIGSIVAHEAGHMFGLGDVHDPTNRMNWSLDWSESMEVPFAISKRKGTVTGSPILNGNDWIQWERKKKEVAK